MICVISLSKLMKFRFIRNLFFALLFIITFPLSVSANGINYEKINPSNYSAYQFKRLKEEVLLRFYSRSKPKKAEYLCNLIDKRLAELKYTVFKDDMAVFEDSNNRYFTSIGKCADYLNENNFSKEKLFVVEKIKLHKPILEEMKNKYEQTTAQWRFIRDNINYIDLYTDQLGG